MARRKTKNITAAGGILLFIAAIGMIGFGIFHEWRVAHSPNLQGTWEGCMFLDYDGIKANDVARTHVILTLVKTNGVYTATTDLVEMGKKNIPLGKVAYHYPYLSIEHSPGQVGQNPLHIWKLRVNAEASQMILDHSTWAAKSAQVLLLRTSTPDPVPAPLADEEFSPRPGSELQGYWEGELTFDTNDFQGMDTNQLPVILKVAEQSHGMFRAEIGWPEFGMGPLPASGNYQGSLVKFTDDVGEGRFQGNISAHDTEMIGLWTHAGKSLPASFKRADYRAEHARDNEKDYSFNSANDLQGHWKGNRAVTVAKIKTTVPLALDIAKMSDGSYSATVSYLEQFENDSPVPAADIEFDPPTLRLQWKWTRLSYEGTLKNGKLTGVWHEGRHTFPLTFERSGSQP